MAVARRWSPRAEAARPAKSGSSDALALGGVLREVGKAAPEKLPRRRARHAGGVLRLRRSGGGRRERQRDSERGGGPPRVEVGDGARHEPRVERLRGRRVAAALMGARGPVRRPALHEHRAVGRDLLVEEARGVREISGRVARPGLGKPLGGAGFRCGVEAHERREQSAGVVGVSGSEGETDSGVEEPPSVLFGQRPREKCVEPSEAFPCRGLLLLGDRGGRLRGPDSSRAAGTARARGFRRPQEARLDEPRERGEVERRRLVERSVRQAREEALGVARTSGDEPGIGQRGNRGGGRIGAERAQERGRRLRIAGDDCTRPLHANVGGRRLDGRVEGVSVGVVEEVGGARGSVGKGGRERDEALATGLPAENARVGQRARDEGPRLRRRAARVGRGARRARRRALRGSRRDARPPRAHRARKARRALLPRTRGARSRASASGRERPPGRSTGAGRRARGTTRRGPRRAMRQSRPPARERPMRRAAGRARPPARSAAARRSGRRSGGGRRRRRSRSPEARAQLARRRSPEGVQSGSAHRPERFGPPVGEDAHELVVEKVGVLPDAARACARRRPVGFFRCRP